PLLASRCAPNVGSGLDQAQPALDAFNPPVEIVEANLRGGVVDLHRSQIALYRGYAGCQFAEPAVDAVEPLVHAREIGTKKREDLGLSGHGNMSVPKWGE